MSDNLPDVRDTPNRAPALADTDSWIGVVGEVAKFAGYIAGTDFVPTSLRDSPASTTAAIMYGREVGLPPMTALTQTHVIEGRPSMSAEAMRALVLAAGHRIQVLESTGAICRMRAQRRGDEEWSPEVVWSIDMARAANLLNKTNWKSWPRRMLQARCTSELCELYFPDVVHGFRSIEEMDDLGAEETAAADVSPAPQSGTRVSRARKTTAAKRAALPAAEPTPAQRPTTPAGPPLPGEAGYDDMAPVQASAGVSGDGPQQPAEESGMDSEGTPAEAASDEVENRATPAEQEPDPEAIDAGQDGEQAKPRTASRAQMRMLFAAMKGLGVEEDDVERHAIASQVLGHPVASFSDLTSRDASTLIDTMARVRSREELYALLDAAAQGVVVEDPPEDD